MRPGSNSNRLGGLPPQHLLPKPTCPPKNKIHQCKVCASLLAKRSLLLSLLRRQPQPPQPRLRHLPRRTGHRGRNHHRNHQRNIKQKKRRKQIKRSDCRNLSGRWLLSACPSTRSKWTLRSSKSMPKKLVFCALGLVASLTTATFTAYPNYRRQGEEVLDLQGKQT
jgi:hypothetical protein